MKIIAPSFVVCPFSDLCRAILSFSVACLAIIALELMWRSVGAYADKVLANNATAVAYISQV